MDQKAALAALAALAQETRLELFRLLVMIGPEGLPAGVIAERLGVLPSSLTFHLNLLHRAGLISQRRRSRQLIYAAEYATMNALLAYLTENCCAGAAGVCNPGETCSSDARQELPAKWPAERQRDQRRSDMEQADIKELVRARYGGIAEAASSDELLRAGSILLRPDRRSDQQIARDGLFGCRARRRAGWRQSRPWLRQSAGDCRR